MRVFLGRNIGDKFTILFNRKPLGQIRSIARAYQSAESEYIYHCEDDWELFRGGFLREELAISEANLRSSKSD